ncbi:DUF6252 family protein [Hymenobacter terricola]|uniref:DUF6252 family protein n=1 Tax=Hymenobacter terricola TaxID=2819236 RepID=UPI001B304FBE|nr:DUF6252 family protein [Hymenobacter terricola]
MKKVLFCLLVLLVSCKKDDGNPLPKATQEGKNTFGCLLDGEVFIPTPSHNVFQPVTPLQGYFYRREIGVKAYGEQGQMYLALRDAFRPGTYSLAETSTGNYGSLNRSSGGFYTSSTHGGLITLTRIDTVARVMAGTFEFSALDRSGGTISVKSGRFDVAF